MRMEIHLDEIDADVQPKLKTAVETLKEADEVLGTIKPPADFRMTGFIKNWSNQLKKTEENIMQISKELGETVNHFREVKNKNLNIINSLPNLNSIGKTFSSTKKSNVVQTTVNNNENSTQINQSSSAGTNKVELGNKVEKPNINEETNQEIGDAEIGNDHINKPNIDDENKNEELNKVEIDKSWSFLPMDEFFKQFEEGTGSYGVDIGAFRNLKELDPIEYDRLKELLVNNYKLSEVDSEELLEIMGNSNDGSYSMIINTLCAYLKYNPEAKEKIFGYPLYVQNKDGEIKLNDKEMLIDYFIWDNKNKEGTNLIEELEDGTLVINKDALTEPIKADENKLNDYLKWKSENLGCTVNEICNSQVNYTGEQLKSTIEVHLELGDEVGLKLSSKEGGVLQLYDAETGNVMGDIQDEEWFKVTAQTEEGLIVSGRGERYLIKYDDIAQNSEFVFIREKFDN